MLPDGSGGVGGRKKLVVAAVRIGGKMAMMPMAIAVAAVPVPVPVLVGRRRQLR